MVQLVKSLDGKAAGKTCCRTKDASAANPPRAIIPAAEAPVEPPVAGGAPPPLSNVALPNAGAYARPCKDSVKDGGMALAFVVGNITCAGCIAAVESTTRAVPGVKQARVNFSTRRLTAEWQGGPEIADRIVEALDARGYQATPFAVAADSGRDDSESRALLRALGVAGFAAANVMLLSVSVWAGLASDMAPGTITLFHWLSALIVLPAVAYAGQPFFRSARSALKGRRLNMDVPISLAVILATAMSLYQTMRGGTAVYFDASITLLFFLLIGRTLDQRVRAKARSAAENLLALKSRTATVIATDGSRQFLRPEELRPGMRVAIAAGERVPADGKLVTGQTMLDTSLLTGESLPETVTVGATIYAGTDNLGGPMEIEVTAADDATLLAEIVRLMEVAEQGRDRYVRLADRIARIYAPAVHILGALTFAVWFILGVGWEAALLNGIAVLIITCPCALGLAVPAVQVVASGRLLKAGVLVKCGDALERLAETDMVIFDKTGTLTTGELILSDAGTIDRTTLALAAGLAQNSRHPLSRALTRAAKAQDLSLPQVEGIEEVPGLGLSGKTADGPLRLGSRVWIKQEDDSQQDISGHDSRAEFFLRDSAGTITRFAFEDRLREDAAETIARLRDLGLAVALLSGDRPAAVAAVAQDLGIDDWQGACLPRDKITRLAKLAQDGRKILMVGDGLNDAPALAAAHASLSPAGAADVAQTAADFIVLHERLTPVAEALTVARGSRRLVLQNFGLAFSYNAIAVPLAMAGLVTPLIAAVAMSLSSIAVTLNALRLRWTS